MLSANVVVTVSEYIAPPANEVIVVPVIELKTTVCEAPFKYNNPPLPPVDDIDVNVE